jgi:hypothetical protein
MLEVRVPDIGDFKDVPVVEVLVNPGDIVKVEDPLITLESEKAIMDVPSSAAGVVKELKVKRGDKVAEGSVIALLEVDDAKAAFTAPSFSTVQAPLDKHLEPTFLPENLWQKCRFLVQSVHEKHGLDALPGKVTTANYMVALSCMSDTFAVMQTNALCFRLGIASWTSAVVFFVLGWVLTWWLLIGAVASVVGAWWLNRRQSYGWMYLGTVCLGMEILSNDFCGWGKAYPDLRDRSLQLLNDDPSRPKTTWLDYYLPNRANLSPETLRQFGPRESTKDLSAMQHSA